MNKVFEREFDRIKREVEIIKRRVGDSVNSNGGTESKSHPAAKEIETLPAM